MAVLDELLGEWRLSMRHVAYSEPVAGTERYERTLAGAFVLMRRTYEHPDFPNALALLSETHAHYFDVRGVTRLFDMEMRIDGWKMVHLDEEFSQRYTARFVGPDEIECHGEASFDSGARWQYDFDMTLLRAA